MIAEWKIGDQIQGRWEIKKIIKSGGMGIVYIVNDNKLGRDLAAKTFYDRYLSDEDSKERFRQECASWINLNTGKYSEKNDDGRRIYSTVEARRSQYIVDALFVENIENRPYLFMEYVGGGDLDEKIKRHHLNRDLTNILRYAIQFCEGILYAYANGIIVHRDIKPTNCLITNNDTIKVTDFGLAKCLGEAILDENAGTLPYMAPEQFRNAKGVDRRADVYSFGVMLYEMITGRLPFYGNTNTWEEFEYLHKNQNPPQLNIQQPELKQLVEKCIAKDPKNRYSDFEVVQETLDNLYKSYATQTAIQHINSMGFDFRVQKSAFYDAIHSFANLGRYEEALTYCDKWVNSIFEDADAWYNKGAILMELKRHKEAINCFDRAIEKNPVHALSWYNRGESIILLKRGPEEAIHCYEQALSINPDFQKAWVSYGACLALLNQFDKALPCFDKAIKLNPNDDKSWINRGILFLNIYKQYSEALSCFEKAYALGNMQAAQGIQMCKQLLKR